ncbi:putative pantothenate transporter [Sclerotinia borealis F-4128]|uniref:Putative pantothenate transporter n=1 Tax=Sclerotinia borealis (strain F-4128) TaxID=1432307 RepID=W9C3K9_SCLBF|nr:putative pantothenate transporter [Sclerotinia borealis F-4128]
MASKEITSIIINDGKETTITPTYEDKPSSLDTSEPIATNNGNRRLHYVTRGQEIADAGLSTESITGYEAEQMRARAFLTFEEEKKLLRRIDWHLMPLLSICFLLKSIDYSNVSNVRIMNTGTDENILNQLGMIPPHAKWLTEKEKAFIQARLPRNAPRSSGKNFDIREILTNLKDIKMWLFTLCWASFTVGTSGLSFYQPTVVVANLGFTSIAKSQLLNFPTDFLTIAIIGIFGIWADTARLPRPLSPLSFLFIILACYSVLYTFPNTGGVYAATLIASSFASSWNPMMWPWRVQTTSRATGSVFSTGFVNSYGQIGGALGPQIFRSQYAPHYPISFAIAMAIVGFAIVMNLVTWYVMREVERGETILEDVDFDVDVDVGGGDGERNAMSVKGSGKLEWRNGEDA